MYRNLTCSLVDSSMGNCRNTHTLVRKRISKKGSFYIRILANNCISNTLYESITYKVGLIDTYKVGPIDEGTSFQQQPHRVKQAPEPPLTPIAIRLHFLEYKAL